MKNRFIKSFILAIVMSLGLVASAFVGTNVSPVFATTSYDMELSRTDKITIDMVKEMSGLSSDSYKYYANGTELAAEINYGLGTTPAKTATPVHGSNTWEVKSNTGSFFRPSYTTLTSGTFIVGLYDYLTVDVNTNAIGEARDYTVSTTDGALTSNGNIYKVFADEVVTITFAEAGEGNKVSLMLNSENQTISDAVDGVHTFECPVLTGETTLAVTYTKDTDSLVSFNNTDVVDYYQVENGSETLLDGKDKPVVAGSVTTIKAIAKNDAEYNVNSLTIAGVSATASSENDNVMVITFTAPEVSTDISLSSSVVASNNTVKMNIPDLNTLADLLLYANISIKYTPNGASSTQTIVVEDLPKVSFSGMSLTSFALSGITNVEYGTDVTITVSAKDGVNYDLVNFKVNDTITSDTTDDTQSITFTAGVGQTYLFGFSVINTTSEISLDSATKELINGGSLQSVIVTVDGVKTILSKGNISTVKATKGSTVSVEYVSAEHYVIDTTAITGVSNNDNTFVAPATKKNITISATTRYTSNTITVDSVSNTKTLVDAGKLEIYVNGAVLTDSTIIYTDTPVTISATSLTNDEIESISVTDGENTYILDNGVVTFTTGENLTYSITVITTATENYVTVVYDESVTQVLVNGTEYVGEAIEVVKLTDITVSATTLANYKVTGITVTANGDTVDADNMTFTGYKDTKYIVTIHTICTDNTINISSSTLSAIMYGRITSLTVNGVEVKYNTSSVTVDKDTTVSVVVTTNDYYLVESITLDDTVLDTPSFEVDESTTYNLSVNIYNASNSIAFSGDESVAITCNGSAHSNIGSIPMNASVTLTVTPVKGEYIVESSLVGADANIDYVSGNAVITFTAGVNEDYALEVTSAPVFTAVANNYVINQQDIALMVNDKNEYARSVVYNGIWNNVFATTTDISLDDVTFEYFAGTGTLNLVLVQYSIDIYCSIDSKNITTKMELCEYYSKYIKEVFNADVSAATIADKLSDESADATIKGLTDFGSKETESVRLVFNGNNRYPKIKLNNTVGALDLREDVTLDLRDRVEVTYGSYTDNSAILDMLLDGKLGVVAPNGDQLFTYNPTLVIPTDLVGKDVGTYTELTVVMPADYYYRKATFTFTLEITKADLSIDIASSVVNYQLVLDGTLNKNYLIKFNPDIEIEDTFIEIIYFTMGLDIVNGELIASVDLSQMTSSSLVRGLIDRAISAIDDDEEPGLTLVEFVEFAEKLSTLMGNEGLNSDVSYLDKVTEMLHKVDEAIDIRIMLITDGSDITPNNHGVYFVGAVSTDTNYNMAMNAGYLVITAEIVDVHFVTNNEENNVRKFEYDGTSKSMTAEAYDINQEVLAGTMKYYYLGVQTDASLYASADAPTHSGAYTVCAIYNNGTDTVLPTKVGVGIGAMIIVPSDDAKVGVHNAVHTYNGEEVDYMSLVETTNADAKVAYITATINVAGDFSEQGFEALDGSVNIDFPARFDTLLEKYFPNEYESGVRVDTLISYLDQTKEAILANGYSVEYIDSLIDMLAQLPNVVLVTFQDISTQNPTDIGVYLLGAVIFDPNYIPEFGMGVVVVEPEIAVSTMTWNYTDSNGIITVPALSKVDMGATINGESNAVVEYVYFGLDTEGHFVKVTDVADITTGAWMQLAYVHEEVSASMNLVLPIARMFLVLPQNVDVTIADGNDNGMLLRTYNGAAHSVTATASLQNGTQLDSNNIVITYTGVDAMGNKYSSTTAPINAGVYAVTAYYVENTDTTTKYVGFATATLVIALADTEVVVEDVTVCVDGNEHNITIVEDANAEYVYVIYNNGILNIVLPEAWDIDTDAIKTSLAKYLSADAIAKLQELVEGYADADVVINGAMPTEIGEYQVSVIAIIPNYNIAVSGGILTIKDHNLVHHDALEPTCLDKGYLEYDTCVDCDYTTFTEVDALGHNVVVDEAVSATCAATGLTEGSHCDRCGEILVAQEVTDKLAHTPSDWIETLAPTCIAAGSEHIVCTVCGEELNVRDIAMIEHDLEYRAGKPATCTEEGWSAHRECTMCGYNNKTVLHALGHRVVTDAAVSATCTSTGLTAGSHCSRCRTVFVPQVTTNIIDHIISNWITNKIATCTEEGSASKICIMCYEVMESMVLSKVSHDLDYHDGREATCTTHGWDPYVTCDNCDYTTFERIEAYGHSAVIDAAVPATCVTTGLTTGSHCSTCNAVLVAQQVVAKVDHTYSNWAVEFYATATTNGRYVRTCTECSHKQYDIIPAFGDKELGNIEITDTDNGKVTIDEDLISDAVKDVEETGNKEVVVSGNESTNLLTNVEIKTSSLQEIVDVDSSLTIKTANVHATFDKDALSTILAESNGEEDVTFDLRMIAKEELNNAQIDSLDRKMVTGVLRAQVICGDGTISNFGGGKVQVSIPFAIAEGKSSADYKIYYVADDGSIEELATTYVNGELVVELEHFSEYVIVDTSVTPMSTASIVLMISLFAALALLSALVMFDSFKTAMFERRARHR